MTYREAEFASLRQTIAARGTTRIVLLVATVVAWAALATTLGLLSDLPLLVIIPLAVLSAGYEAVWALHVGAERIGRFIQVVHESAGQASWERIAMAASPGLAGAGINPLFTAVFAGASLVNLCAAFVAEPTPVELVLLFGCHAAFLLRLIQTRVMAPRQRRADLDALSAARAASVDDTGGAAAPPDFEKS